MSIPNDLIAQARGLSLKNRPTTANDGNELRLVLARSLTERWTAGAAVNPEYFAKFLAVVPVTTSWPNGFWPRPADALNVLRITGSAASRVIVVPADESGIYWAGQKRVARWAGGYISVSTTDGPVQPESLTMYYVRTPALPASLDDPLDAGWPSAYDTLLVLDLGVYLAQKDGRMDELPGLEKERDAWEQLYLAYLQSETELEQRVFHPDRVTELVKRPLAGGAQT